MHRPVVRHVSLSWAWVCNMLFCICELFVSSELSFNIPTVRYTLGSLVFVEVGCSVQVLLLLVVYADPWLPGTNRLYAWTNHLPHLLTTSVHYSVPNDATRRLYSRLSNIVFTCDIIITFLASIVALLRQHASS